ncbi:DJ-1/PfpI family protein [Candidatus Pelagibacter communis]|uniref:DJ-1/PfpI family protein n=1 Tax=Pelagibacter ubique TaxID=198252 RepID=UPI00094D0EC3|nr:DJ-1/PfpI family protein [Candidatus Pelagibacter ubique]|tara:strand:- start:115 stop:651 length:537 start_codon:yes stop_codon:yes gene_type:complete
MFKAVIISGPLAQDHEFIYPYYRLLEERCELDVCIIGGKPTNGILGTVLPPNKDHNVKDINEISHGDYDLLVLPGGVKAMEKIRQNDQLIKFIKDFYELNNKNTIACICSGTQLLISAKVVNGKKISGYYSMKDDIINAGAIYTDNEVVADQRIFTTAHYKDMAPWLKAAIEHVKSQK